MTSARRLRAFALAALAIVCMMLALAPASSAAEQAAPMVGTSKRTLCPFSHCKVGTSIGGSNNRYYAGNVVVSYTHRGSGSRRQVCPTSLTGTNLHEIPIRVTVTYRNRSTWVDSPSQSPYAIPLPWRACFNGLTLQVGIEAYVFGGRTEYKPFPTVSIS